MIGDHSLFAGSLLAVAVGLATMSGCGAPPDPPAARPACIAGVNVGPGDRRPTETDLRRLCATDLTGPLPAVRDGDRTAFAGRTLVITSGCLACHRIAGQGNHAPGPPLTDIGSRLPASAIRRSLVHPVAPMPSYRRLGPRRLAQIAAYLERLRAP